MSDERHIEKFLRWAIFPVLLLVFVAQIYSCRGLYADGANFLYGILMSEDIPWWDAQRVLNHLVTKTPTVLLVKLGVHDLVVLRYFFSAWILFCPLAVWAAAMWQLRRDVLYWPFVLTFCFIYFNTNFFSIGEYNLCFALLGYCFAGLVRPLPESKVYRASLLVAAALLSFNYPATLFAGSFLFVLIGTKKEEDWNGASHAFRAALALCMVVSVTSALWEVVAPRDPANLAGARSIDALLLDTQFWCVLGYSLIVTGMFFLSWKWLRQGMALVCLYVLVKLFLDHFRLFPPLHYGIRAYMSLAISACGVGLWWFRVHGQKYMRSRSKLMLPALMGTILLGCLSLFDVQMSFDYARYLDAYQAEVNSKTGLIPYERSYIPYIVGNDRFNWGWTQSLMSVILRQDSTKAVILNPVDYHGYQPFDPYEKVPDLSRYYR